MKKLLFVFLVLLFVAPAIAADWSFYGSERVATWYVDRNYGSKYNAPSGFNHDNDQGTEWFFQGNSRFGAKVKADQVTGQIEMGLNAGGSTSVGAATDDVVKVRRAFGVWKVNDTVSLKVGKDYSPVTDFISNQWFDSDNDMWGNGDFYGKRPPQIALNIGAFELAFLTPIQGQTGGIGSTTSGIRTQATSKTMSQSDVAGNPDVYLPKIEAAYQIKLGAGYIRPFAGFQYYQVHQTAAAAYGAGVTSLQQEADVLSYVVGVSTSWNIGAFSIGAQVNYGQNESSCDWQSGYNAVNASLPILKNGGKGIYDVNTLQAMLVPALKLTDTLRFEAGFGYRVDMANGAHGYSQNDGSWVAYLQALITFAPGVYLCPEVGYIDYMESRAGVSEGQQWYAGAKSADRFLI